MPKWPSLPIGPNLLNKTSELVEPRGRNTIMSSVNPAAQAGPGPGSNGVGPEAEPPPRFMPPPPPPPLPPPPAHMQLFNSSLVMIKTEPLNSEELSLVNNPNFSPEYDDSNTSSHEEILNSEFGQTVRETAPSGRTVLGNLKNSFTTRQNGSIDS